MRVFIAGIDGYLGWSLAQYLVARGHEVSGCDNLMRRKWVLDVGGESITPILDFTARIEAFGKVNASYCDLTEYARIIDKLKKLEPEAIVYFAEMPSAPYSMIGAKEAMETQFNNVIGNLHMLWAMKDICPEAHLIHLGTMGEYGTPDIDIPEGFCEMEFRGRKDWVMFPRKAGSFYHLTKVHDAHNIDFACRMWGLRATDIMQGVVFGTRIPEMTDDDWSLTRFDVDECFGTAINRFCACAVIGHPLTVFGAGHQKRGFLPLKDSMQCLTLAIENPPKEGEYRVFNQFEAVYDLTELANLVQTSGSKLGMKVEVLNYENPRKEAEEHYYNPDRVKLIELGYQPTRDIEGEVTAMLEDLSKYKDRIGAVRDVLIPKIRWDGTKRRSQVMEVSSEKCIDYWRTGVHRD